MNKMDLFGFFPITEDSTQVAATIACELAHEFSCAASNYGDGVKSITATLILTDPNGLGAQHKDELPRFNSGLRRIRAFGTTVELEDELQFSVRPNFSIMSIAKERIEVASAIASALIEVHPRLAVITIPQFNMAGFLRDIETFFASTGRLG